MENKSGYPSLSRSVGNFINEEDGSISRNKVLAVGSLMLVMSIIMGADVSANMTFDGYFLVYYRATYVYKGKIWLPNGDTFDGEFDVNSPHYPDFKNGTYTWKNGKSYKGEFCHHGAYPPGATKKEQEAAEKRKEQVIGSTSARDGTPAGYYYFDKTGKNYLYITFYYGVPTGRGVYCKNGVKYNVRYVGDGECIETKKQQ